MPQNFRNAALEEQHVRDADGAEEERHEAVHAEESDVHLREVVGRDDRVLVEEQRRREPGGAVVGPVEVGQRPDQDEGGDREEVQPPRLFLQYWYQGIPY